MPHPNGVHSLPVPGNFEGRTRVGNRIRDKRNKRRPGRGLIEALIKKQQDQQSGNPVQPGDPTPPTGDLGGLIRSGKIPGSGRGIPPEFLERLGLIGNRNRGLNPGQSRFRQPTFGDPTPKDLGVTPIGRIINDIPGEPGFDPRGVQKLLEDRRQQPSPPGLAEAFESRLQTIRGGLQSARGLPGGPPGGLPPGGSGLFAPPIPGQQSGSLPFSAKGGRV